jgi:hypothetical protein
MQRRLSLLDLTDMVERRGNACGVGSVEEAIEEIERCAQ